METPINRSRRPKPYDEQHVTVYSNDPEHKVLNFEYISDREFIVDADEVIQGVAVIILSDKYKFTGFKGVYIGKGPTNHNDLLSEARRSLDKYVPDPSSFEDRNFCHGFYTNKGYFYTRRDIIIVVEKNQLPIAVGRGEINHHHGLLSSDIWDSRGNSPCHPKKLEMSRGLSMYSKGIGHISADDTKPTGPVIIRRPPGYSPLGSKKKNKR